MSKKILILLAILIISSCDDISKESLFIDETCIRRSIESKEYIDRRIELKYGYHYDWNTGDYIWGWDPDTVYETKTMDVMVIYTNSGARLEVSRLQFENIRINDSVSVRYERTYRNNILESTKLVGIAGTIN